MTKIKFSLVQFLMLMSIINTAFSQSDTIQKRWSVSAYGGAIFPSSSNNSYTLSENMGADISYRYIPEISIYLNFSYNLMNNNQTFGLLESTLGTRFYLAPKLGNPYVELGFGYYQRFYKNPGYYFDDRNYDEFGINAGLGTEINITERIQIPIKFKLHIINFLVDGDQIAYSGFYTGIKYSF